MIQDFSSPSKSTIYSRIVIDLIVMPIVFNAQRERETLAITRQTCVSQTLAKLGVSCIQLCRTGLGSNCPKIFISWQTIITA